MKKVLLITCFVIMLLLSVACNNTNVVEVDNNIKIEKVIEETKENIQNKKTNKELFYEVLKGERDIIFVDYLYKENENKSTTDTINNILNEREEEIGEIALVDFDNDNMDEILIALNNWDNIVLRLENDNVYGYFFPYRVIFRINSDGRFLSYPGPGMSSINKIEFDKEKYKVTVLQEQEEVIEELSFFKINGLDVSKEECEKYWSEFYSDDEVEYYKFSEETLLKLKEDRLGEEEISGFSGDDDYYKRLLIDSESGDVDAQNMVANLYFEGKYFEKNYEKSFYWSSKAANSGNSSAMFNVGWDYYNGFFNEINYEKAFYWFNKAAQDKQPNALNMVGLMYQEGKGVDIDYHKAYKYNLEAAGFFHNYSMYNIADLIYNNQVENYDKNHVFWAEMAAKGNQKIDIDEKYLNYKNIIIDEYEIPSAFDINLIDEFIKSIYSGKQYEFIENYEVDTRIEYGEVEIITDKEYSSLTTFGLYSWYQSNHLLDINNNGKMEYVNYFLDGSAGFAGLSLAVENEDGVFKEENSHNYFYLGYGYNRFIEFNGKKYLIIAIPDLNYGNIKNYEIVTVSKDYEIEVLNISLKDKNVGYIKTYITDNNFSPLVGKVTSNFNNIMKINEKYDYIEISDQCFVGSVDINNDGKKEYYNFYRSYTSTVNWQTQMFYKDVNEDDEKIIRPLFEKEQSRLQYLDIIEFNNENYVYTISQGYNSPYFNLSIYYLKADNIQLISNHLVYVDNIFSLNSEYWKNRGKG